MRHKICTSSIGTIWLVIIARGSIFAFLQVKSHLQKLKLRQFCHPCAKRTNQVSIPGLLGTIYIAANITVSVNVPLTAIPEAIQEIDVLHKHRHTNQTWRKAESGSNRYYECPGYEGTLPCHTGKKSLNCHLFCKRF